MPNMENILVGGLSYFFFAVFGPFFLLALAFVYLGLRLRDLRGDNPDPMIGVKSVYHYFLTLGILLGLAGVTTIAVDMMDGVFEDKPTPAIVPVVNPRMPNVRPPVVDNEFFNSTKLRRHGPGLVRRSL